MFHSSKKDKGLLVRALYCPVHHLDRVEKDEMGLLCMGDKHDATV